MQCELQFGAWSKIVADWLVIPADDTPEITGFWQEFDEALGGQLTRLRESQDFTGKTGELVTLLAPTGIGAKRLLLVGTGPSGKSSVAELTRALTTATRTISKKQVDNIAVVIPKAGPAVPSLEKRVELTITALHVGGVGQDLYRAEKKRFPFNRVQLVVETQEKATAMQPIVEQGNITGEAINLARELVNLPAKVLYPASFADRATELAAAHGVTCQVLDESALQAENMGSLLAVSSGSNQPPRVVVLEYNGPSAKGPTLALVGKGVTFDSGGLSLKPNDSMLTMKCDMAGAATVLATVIAIARLQLPVRVIGVMGLVENMTGGSAMKLGDVLTARSGTTIEVLNTDAEGRLVLADVLDYAVSRGADYIVDLATLTGACVVALGEDVVGAMSNNQSWCGDVLTAARTAGEDIWQLPMFEQYAKLIESDVADIKNVGGRWGGAITAAKFLERFVHDKPWVHLDIAGPAFASSDKPHREGGGTGCMVPTLLELARNFSTTHH